MPRTTKDILAHADELAKKFEDYQPREGDRRDAAVLAAQRAAPVARFEAERQLVDHIVAAQARPAVVKAMEPEPTRVARDGANDDESAERGAHTEYSSLDDR
ncbi:hypothetical protein EEB14_40185 [Rhodococcus sp. WS4]|nr:hypothetical protein EEB14_40185 [Rhodococcus sp. WS4]